MNEGRNILKRYHAPGLWEDIDGNIHWSLPDVLKHIGVEDTPENRKEAMAAIQELVRNINPSAHLLFRKTPNN
jgi:hypothetical protein